MLSEEKDTDGELPADPREVTAIREPGTSMTGARLDMIPTLTGPITSAQEGILARRTFPGLPSQVRVVRRWLAQMVDGFAAVDDVLLACSELAANAIMHSDSGRAEGRFTVRLAIGPDMVRIEVLDQGGPWSRGRNSLAVVPEARENSTVPEARTNSTDGEPNEDASQCGRGLTIVAAITDAWGITGDHEGRTAWCEIRSK